MKIIDITFDFETVARGADAAPMQLAAVAWDRESNGEHPFTGDTFNTGIDLRSCVMKGLKFDQDTMDWWAKQDRHAQEAVLSALPCDLDNVIGNFIEWVRSLMGKYKADAVCLWCQGMDFDVPILKNCCFEVGIDIDKEINYQWFCDARSFVLQGLQVMFPDKVDMAKPKEAYKLLPDMGSIDKMPEELDRATDPHDALYDSKRSTWNVWQVMKMMRAKNESY